MNMNAQDNDDEVIFQAFFNVEESRWRFMARRERGLPRFVADIKKRENLSWLEIGHGNVNTLSKQQWKSLFEACARHSQWDALT